MYGEKVEETEELRLDLQDVKDMYKMQIEDLLRKQTSNSKCWWYREYNNSRTTLWCGFSAGVRTKSGECFRIWQKEKKNHSFIVFLIIYDDIYNICDICFVFLENLIVI